MSKKRVLFCNDSSLLGTGFGTFAYELLTRLAQTEKFELAEFANYGYQKEEIDRRLKWTYFGNQPEQDSELEAFKSRAKNEFGEWKFDDACLQFRPDIVIAITDVWMWDYMQRSPARKFFNHCVITTVDSEPENESHLASYRSVDGLYCYSDYGTNLLKSYNLKVGGRISPAANPNYFFPAKNKDECKKALELPENSYVIGTVMRNQSRKLFPDLIDSFKEYLTIAGPNMAVKSYLYLHTAYPDVGWDLPHLIKNSGLGHRIYITYMCESCNAIYGSLYQDSLAVCRHCGKLTASTPTYKKPISPSTLGDIYRTFDCYVQYSSSEGFGMPLVEAAYSGLPVFGSDYSATDDVIKKLNGYSIKTKRYYTEAASNYKKSMPDNTDLAEKLVKFFSSSSQMRAKRGFETLKSAEKYFTYDRAAELLEEYLDNAVIPGNWDSPEKLHIPTSIVPDYSNMSNIDFVNYCIAEIAGRPDLLNSYIALALIRDLNVGWALEGSFEGLSASTGNIKPRLTREVVLNAMYLMKDIHNDFERKRTSR